MTKSEAFRQTEQSNRLMSLGFSYAETETLRRISMTLHRWFELECGDSNTYGSWAIERDDNGDGKPFLVHHHYNHGNGKDTVSRTPIADRERGAIKRLKAILASYPTLTFYVQGDPRGAALYIIRPGDVPEGKDINGYYNRGICVY